MNSNNHDESRSTSVEDKPQPPSTPQSIAIHQWRHSTLLCISDTLLKSLVLTILKWRSLRERYVVNAGDVLNPGFTPMWISDYREMLSMFNADLEIVKVIIRASLAGLDPPQEHQAFGLHEFMPPPPTVDRGVEYRRAWAKLLVIHCLMILRWAVRVVSQRVPEGRARYDSARDLDEVFLAFKMIVTRLQEMVTVIMDCLGVLECVIGDGGGGGGDGDGGGGGDDDDNGGEEGGDGGNVNPAQRRRLE
ncbi:hypothetical protein QJS04_geneDACA022798 [Acorus gramineus]|uniref:Ciliary neurotrophic factor n=1 Tax=Acorus gramineus TaxID=55184 RepID=A0AAV9B406_ACOGR|nr:hypothetical protein QJS04_geneDACA022798 [Acorus gramineus]